MIVNAALVLKDTFAPRFASILMYKMSLVHLCIKPGQTCQYLGAGTNKALNHRQPKYMCIFSIMNDVLFIGSLQVNADIIIWISQRNH